MRNKRVWWAAAIVIVAGLVGGAATTGVMVQRSYADLAHGPAFEIEQPNAVVEPVEPTQVDVAALTQRLQDVADSGQAAGTLGAQVVDATTGQVVWERNSTNPMTPASSTKVLTMAAAQLALSPQDTLKTTIVAGNNPGEVVIKASGDVWLSPQQLDEAVAKLQEKGPVTAVFIDTTVWTGPEQAPGWEPDNVDGGYVAPMQPAMIHGGRIGEPTGDVPRSHTPALDVAQYVADKVGAKTVGFSVAPANSATVAQMESPQLWERMQLAMKDSDNVMAEAIGRELAIKRGKPASFAGATQAIIEILQDNDLPVGGVFLEDASGLSLSNRIPAAALNAVFVAALTDAPLRPLLADLPVAGGDGTLYTRYADLSGRGFVRAKTGTLTGVSALAGVAQGQSGRMYAFSFLINEGDVLAARELQDQLASVLHDF